MKKNKLALHKNIIKNIYAISIILNLFIAASPTFIFWGCASQHVDQSNPEELLKDAEDDIAGKRYLMAIDKLKSIKNKFPYSKLAATAQLRVADCYYLEELFIEAAVAYEIFRDLHPKHEQVDYAIFRIGASYYNQLPSNVDRDVSMASKAIEAFEELAKLYPNSQYSAEGRSLLKESFEALAAKEIYIADFYYKQDQFSSASGRYENVIKQYPQTSYLETAYYGVARSYGKLSDKQDEATQAYKNYLEKFPEGKFAKNAERWLQSKTE